MKSYLERELESYFRYYGLSCYTREYEFAKEAIGRKWRADFAFVKHKIAVEVQGGLFVGGGHNRGAAFLKECDKKEAYLLLGWRLYEVPAPWIVKGKKRVWDERIHKTIRTMMEG